MERATILLFEYAIGLVIAVILICLCLLIHKRIKSLILSTWLSIILGILAGILWSSFICPWIGPRPPLIFFLPAVVIGGLIGYLCGFFQKVFIKISIIILAISFILLSGRIDYCIIISPDIQSLIKITIKTDKSIYEIGEKIYVEVSIKNKFNKVNTISGIASFQILSYKKKFWAPFIWSPVSLKSKNLKSNKKERIYLYPGYKKKLKYNLSDLKWDSLYSSFWPKRPLNDFIKIGKFRIVFNIQTEKKIFSSNEVTIKIVCKKCQDIVKILEDNIIGKDTVYIKLKNSKPKKFISSIYWSPLSSQLPVGEEYNPWIWDSKCRYFIFSAFTEDNVNLLDYLPEYKKFADMDRSLWWIPERQILYLVDIEKQTIEKILEIGPKEIFTLNQKFYTKDGKIYFKAGKLYLIDLEKKTPQEVEKS